MKKIIFGFVIGVLLTACVTVFAAELNIIPNPYPVAINGKTADVDGYNINSSTYLKLADFEKAGLDVNFNKDKKEIEITTPAIKPVSTTPGAIENNNQPPFNKILPPPVKPD